MPRPPTSRRIAGRPAAPAFRPSRAAARGAGEVVMSLDEFEAMRLADLDGLYQARAAARMGVSRTTFSRIIEAAHRKVADAVVHGKVLRFEGGPVRLAAYRCCSRHGAAKAAPPPGGDP